MRLILIIFYIFLIYSSIQSLNIFVDEEDENTIYITSKVNEVFASTQIIQYFINHLDESIELSISFPIIDEISLSKFFISIGEKVIISKIMEKETAEEKYKEALEEGNTGFISMYDEGKVNYIVNIGNIKPKQKVILNSFFIQTIGSQDMSYEFIIMEKYPTFHYKELNINNPRNKKIKANFKIETQSKITRIIAPFYDEEAKKKSKYEISFDKDFKEANIKYEKNPDNQKNIDEIKFGPQTGYPGQVNKPTFLTSFCILFRTENMYKPTLYYQYNQELNEISYSINYVYSSEILKNIPIPEQPDQDNKISYYLKYQDNNINETPGLFIFLIDQSGSMQGKSIGLVREALLLFIQSLPPGSYFQFIGFGSDYKKYNNIPVEYNQENVNNIINVISNLQADMGGTNIGSPLNDIYKDINYSKIKLSKNILILTDGQVHDREQCINLITANSNKFRIHALGIGDSFDKILIERSGKLGKGSSIFVEDVEKIKIAVINTLNKCLRPYLIDIKFNFQNYKNIIDNSIIITEPSNNFSFQDEIINFSFILKEESQIEIDEIFKSFKIEITGKNPTNLFKENISFDKFKNIIHINNGNEMSKMIVGKALKYNKELTNNINKEIEFSKKYQILSKNTALFAEIINDKNDSEKNELIRVNLNDYSNNNIDYNMVNFRRRNGGGMKTHRIRNLYDSNSLFDSGPIQLMSCSVPVSFIETSYSDSPINKKNDSSENINNNNLSGLDNNILMSQDIIEGYWNENEYTKKLVNIITQEKFNKITDRIKKLNKSNEEIKIKYTILVIYYLKINHSDKLDEYKFIINKAKKYLTKQGIKYETIIDGI